MSNPFVVGGRKVVLLPSTVITTATSYLGTAVVGLAGMRHLVVQTIFFRGGGGTTAKVFIQSTVDGGTTWFDVMQMAFTTSSATKVGTVGILSAGVNPAAVGSLALADDTIADGFLGDQLKVTVVTVGTYTTLSTVAVTAFAKA